MSILSIIVLQIFIAGLLGVVVRTNIAAFLLSTESVDSPKILRRLIYRYLIFSTHYMLSFMLTHLILAPMADFFQVVPAQKDVEMLLYLLACIPLAAAFYYLDHKFMVWSDARKIKGRERYRRKWGP